jgi:Na+/H+-dicarboxylate symporter
MSPTIRVLVGVGAGLALGITAASLRQPGVDAVVNAIEPIGTLWLRALQMTVVPLVVSLLVTAVAAASDAAATGRLAARALVLFALLLTTAAMLAAVAAPLAFALLPADPSGLAALRAETAAALPAEAPTVSEWIAGIIPSNPVRAAADGAILQIVVFALFLGFALARIDPARRARLVEFFQAIGEAMMVVVGWILWAAPVGVLALALPIGALLGVSVLGAVASYVVITSVICVVITLALYPVVMTRRGLSLGRFARATAPAQMVAFSTQSSLASLPAMLEGAQNQLALPAQVSSFVLPLAVSLFRITSPPAYLAAAAFSAWLYGVELSPVQLATGVAVSVIVSLGAVSLPNQVSFMGTHMPVLQAMGVPLEPLGLMLAVSSIPDLFMTVGNVTADLTVVALVSEDANSAKTALKAGSEWGESGH